MSVAFTCETELRRGRHCGSRHSSEERGHVQSFWQQHMGLPIWIIDIPISFVYRHNLTVAERRRHQTVTRAKREQQKQCRVQSGAAIPQKKRRHTIRTQARFTHTRANKTELGIEFTRLANSWRVMGDKVSIIIGGMCVC